MGQQSPVNDCPSILHGEHSTDTKKTLTAGHSEESRFDKEETLRMMQFITFRRRKHRFQDHSAVLDAGVFCERELGSIRIRRVRKRFILVLDNSAKPVRASIDANESQTLCLQLYSKSGALRVAERAPRALEFLGRQWPKVRKSLVAVAARLKKWFAVSTTRIYREKLC